MAAQKAESNLYYRVPEEAFDRLQLVRDSLKLLMNCAEDGQRGTLEPRLLASYLQLQIMNVNPAKNRQLILFGDDSIPRVKRGVCFDERTNSSGLSGSESDLRLREHLHDRLGEKRIARGRLLQMPSLLHRSAA